MTADRSRRRTTARWEQAVNRALERVNRLSHEDKLAIALRHFQSVTAEDLSPLTTATVRNIGPGRGKAVPQIYLTHPPDAGEPPAQLKAFDVVRFEPGEARNVKINLLLDDLAIFDERSGSRVVPPAQYEIQLGVSSAELLAKAELQIGSGPSQQADGAR